MVLFGEEPNLELIIQGIKQQEDLVRTGKIEVSGKFNISDFWIKKAGKNMVDPSPEKDISFSWQFDGKKFLCHEKFLAPQTPVTKKLEQYSGYDGENFLTYYYVGRKEASVSLYDSQLATPLMIPYFLCLAVKPLESISQTIQTKKARLVGKETLNGCTNYIFILETSSSDEITRIYVDADNGYRVRKIWFKSPNNETIKEVTEFKKYGEEIWFPVKAHEAAWHITPGGEKNLIEEGWITVVNANLNLILPDSAFKIVFDEGTLVNDSVTRTSYKTH